MGVRELYDADENASVMYCSTSGLAFGPVFEGRAATDFVAWANGQDDIPDLRTAGLDVEQLVKRWRTETPAV
jgi:hypothetical protein